MSKLRKLHPLWIAQRFRSYLKVKQMRDREQNEPVEVTLYGQKLWVRPMNPDFKVAIASLGNEFEPMKGTLPSDFNGLIVDAGGYIGTAAIRLSQMWPHATVVTIEPATENLRLLEMNIASYPSIKAINAALVADSTEDLTLYDRGTGAWGFTIVEDAKGMADPKAMHTVKTVTLADIRKQFGNSEIGAVKLDIEGGEKALFDAKDPELHAAQTIFVELHDRIIEGCSTSFKKFSRDRTISKPGREKYVAIKKA